MDRERLRERDKERETEMGGRKREGQRGTERKREG